MRIITRPCTPKAKSWRKKRRRMRMRIRKMKKMRRGGRGSRGLGYLENSLGMLLMLSTPS
jgi:hypothetical protein